MKPALNGVLIYATVVMPLLLCGCQTGMPQSALSGEIGAEAEAANAKASAPPRVRVVEKSSLPVNQVCGSEGCRPLY